ncbi:DUF922 domain-containing protein [Algibacter aquimarinus]|uniref:DUF922 domain-containing protein n=1 Tax=Algibacter aquimarinus TaxID=1136748 RepID=A0ABP9HNV0_9FLAO
MSRIFLLILCLLPFQKDEPVLSWNESYKLTWADFRGLPNNQVSAAAVTASGITFGFSVRETNSVPVSFTTEVHAHFYPEKSWYKPKLADAHVLGHEQLHYDITELHARKFRKGISQFKVSSSIKNNLRSLHKTINKALAEMQNSYDAETDYSRNNTAQLKWKLYIERELEKLSEFKSLN